VQRARRAAHPLDGDHRLAIQRQQRHETAVDRVEARAAARVGSHQRHRAGAALALRAALLAAGQPAAPQPAEQRHVVVGVVHPNGLVVEHEAHSHGESV
jgi:hypothetical protein